MSIHTQIRRGDIYYIQKGVSCGSEQIAGRPGIIVSNNKCNEVSGVVEVVFLTTQEKRPMPTHVRITSAPRESIALCEQINSVDTERIGNYCGHLTDKEMSEVDRALAVSLGIDSEAMLKSFQIDDEEGMALIAINYLRKFVSGKVAGDAGGKRKTGMQYIA